VITITDTIAIITITIIAIPIITNAIITIAIITNTIITIAIITITIITIAIISITIIIIAIITISRGSNLQYTPRLSGKSIADFTGKSESGSCSPQDPIAYLCCGIEGCYCQHHDHETSCDLVAVDERTIWFRL
jgi:hypothetical protein